MSPWQRILLAALIAPLVLVLAEVGLRIGGYRPNPLDRIVLDVTGLKENLHAVYDEHLFWRMPAPPPVSASPDGKDLRVLCLADSVGVTPADGSYPKQLQRLLVDRLRGRNVVVHNASVAGYTSLQGRRLFGDELVYHRFQVVVINFGWNDHWQSGNGVPDRAQRPPRGWALRLMRASRLAGWLNTQLRHRQDEEYNPVGPMQTARVPLADYQANLEAMIAIARAHKMTAILLTAPYLDRDQPWEKTHVRYNGVVRQLAARHRLPLVDRVEAFRSAPELFLSPREDQVHINARGARVVAAEIARVLTER